MRKLVKRWSCIALCTSLVLTGSFVMPFQSSKVLAAEQQTGVVSSENLLKNPELNPNTANGNEPHWWYGNNGAKVTTVTGTDQDGNNQYVEVSNRSL